MEIKPTILIVDNDYKAGKLLFDALVEHGYSPTMADTGRDAAEKVLNEPVPVVVIDLAFEDNSGIELLKKIKVRSPESECILITSHASLSTAIDAINFGAFSYVEKPYEIGELLVIINRAIEKYITLEKLREDEDRFRNAFENAHDGVCLVDSNGRFIKVNQAMSDLVGYSRKELESKTVLDVTHPEDKVLSKSAIQSVISGKQEHLLFEKRYIHKKGTPVICQVSSSIFRDEEGRPLYFITHIHDMSDRKKAELEIERKNKELAEMNAALEVLLKKREKDKTDLEQQILSNIKNLIMPYLKNLKKITRDDQQKTYLRLIESNFKDILSPLPFRLSSSFHHLTPNEIKIASLIKNGETNKEIAHILHVSIKTVEFHRTNIRRKLGIKNQKINLRSFLLSLP